MINRFRSVFGRRKETRSAAVIVAHPDDETLWAGGEILAVPHWEWFVLALSRANDPDRAARFWRAVSRLGSMGSMADLDDSPEQAPLPQSTIQETILHMLPDTTFDVVLTHGPEGEYTRHRRHEEVSAAVSDLWRRGELSAHSLMMFAYADGGPQDPPRPRQDAHIRRHLSRRIWQDKYRILTELYGFSPESWEASIMPREEAFYYFDTPERMTEWLVGRGVAT